MNGLAPVVYENNKLTVLDQTVLPGEEKWINLDSSEAVYEAVKKLRVRGAPAIGVCVAYGLYVALKDKNFSSAETFRKAFIEEKEYLEQSRPTAVNLFWALDRMKRRFDFALEETKPDGVWERRQAHIKEALLNEAHAIRQEDEESCRAMGEYGLQLLQSAARSPETLTVLTHCNAGALATTGYGTCLAPVYLAKERGCSVKVFSDETRPLLQGARLTCWELNRAGVDVTLICDNMAYTVLKEERPDAVVVGCDRMAANGDGANKIGTAGLAVMAHELGIPFYMFVPTSTIDLNTPTGREIKIEKRDGEEICEMWYSRRMAPQGISTFNPAFDVTEHKYITAVITERGVARPPYETSLPDLFR